MAVARFYDYVSEAALLMPCALNADAFDGVRLRAPRRRQAGGRRSSLRIPAGRRHPESGHACATGGGSCARCSTPVAGPTRSIAAGSISTAFDLWRAVAVTYAASYTRASATDMPCGYSFQAMDAKGLARPRAPPSRQPGGAIRREFRRAPASASTTAWPQATIRCCPACAACAGFSGARRARRSPEGGRCRDSRRTARPGLPVLVIHGADDGLVPEAFSGGAYAQWTKSAGRDVRYWKVANAQHFDAFLGLPALGSDYVPMLPYAYRGLDAMWSHLFAGEPLPGDARIATTKRKSGATGLAPLTSENLGQMP